MTLEETRDAFAGVVLGRNARCNARCAASAEGMEILEPCGV